jgi:hypothetical protein
MVRGVSSAHGPESVALLRVGRQMCRRYDAEVAGAPEFLNTFDRM